MSGFLDFAAGLLCVGAGLYLLQTQPADSNSLFGPLLHGMGVYFIGKGIFVWRAAHLSVQANKHLAALVAANMPEKHE